MDKANGIKLKKTMKRLIFILIFASLSIRSATPQVPSDPFAVNPDIVLFARRVTMLSQTTQGKLEALIRSSLQSQDQGGLGIEYDNTYTRTVDEVWRDRKANCLSLTAFFVGAARSSGIEIRFADSLGINRWKKIGTMIRLERHIVAYLPKPGFRDLVADFIPEYRRSFYFLEPLDNRRIHSLFYSNRAVELLDDQKLDEALGMAQQALIEDNGSTVGWNILGVVQKTLKQLPEAEAAFKEAIRLDAKDGIAYGNLETLYLDQERVAEAASVRTSSVQIRQNDPYFLGFLAEESRLKGQQEDALRLIDKSLEMTPHEVEFYLVAIQIHRDAHRDKQAMALIDKGMKEIPLEERYRLERLRDEIRESQKNTGGTR